MRQTPVYYFDQASGFRQALYPRHSASHPQCLLFGSLLEALRPSRCGHTTNFTREMYNNAPLIVNLGSTFQDSDTRPRSSPPRNKIGPEPCLIERLPSTGELYYSILDQTVNFLKLLSSVRLISSCPKPSSSSYVGNPVPLLKKNGARKLKRLKRIAQSRAPTMRMSILDLLTLGGVVCLLYSLQYPPPHQSLHGVFRHRVRSARLGKILRYDLCKLENI